MTRSAVSLNAANTEPFVSGQMIQQTGAYFGSGAVPEEMQQIL